jgi:tRNA modification GTPase
MIDDKTICAIATPPGTGAISIIRLSGSESLLIADNIFQSVRNKKKLINQNPFTIHFGNLVYKDQEIDQVMCAIYKAPHSYTGEDVVEISCHGSIYIQQKILEILIANGARHAEPGEFTMRAFLNGKMDLSQSEAVADLIGSKSKTLHDAALKQIRGGFSNEISILRNKLLQFVSLVELELDFSEEDVNFADRNELTGQIEKIQYIVQQLIGSFKYGNVVKNGVPVAIVGNPNVGKSTLLNLLLKEEKAIVSEIPGTTRDAIEDTIIIEGILFRFIDTAGIRHTTDKLESLGIERTYENIRKANIVLFLADAHDTIQNITKRINKLPINEDQKLVVLINKTDTIDSTELSKTYNNLKINNKYPIILISAKRKINTDKIIHLLVESVQYNQLLINDIIVINVRHFESLQKVHEAGIRVLQGLQTNLTGDLIAQDLRQMVYYLGTITGEISTDEVLGNIFKNFCIGK